MSNETTTFILDYAEVHHDFSLGDFVCLSTREDRHQKVFFVLVSVQARE